MPIILGRPLLSASRALLDFDTWSEEDERESDSDKEDRTVDNQVTSLIVNLQSNVNTLQLSIASRNLLNIDTIGTNNVCSEYSILKANLATEQERNTSLHTMIEFVEKEKAITVAKKETPTKC